MLLPFALPGRRCDRFTSWRQLVSRDRALSPTVLEWHVSAYHLDPSQASRLQRDHAEANFPLEWETCPAPTGAGHHRRGQTLKDD